MSKPRVLLCFFLAIAVPLPPVSAEEQVKWFVLRNAEVGNCWTAVVIRIDGQYINTFERRAGGPYATEAQALERQDALVNQGTCQKKLNNCCSPLEVTSIGVPNANAAALCVRSVGIFRAWHALSA